MMSVVNGFSTIMAAVDAPDVFRNHLTFGDKDELTSMNMQADGAVGKGSRPAVTVTLESHQAGETSLVCSTKPSNA